MDAIAIHHAAADTSGALLDLLRRLDALGYGFVTPTPDTHGHIRRRAAAGPDDALRDIFGWSRPFAAELLEPPLLELLRRAEVVHPSPEGLRLDIRVSTVGGRLYLHSALTADSDAVFLGPDTYRYERFLSQQLESRPSFETALDIGVGAGVGAMTLAAARPGARVIGADVNPRALSLSRVNAAHAGLEIELRECSGLPPEPARFDLIAANPPYIAGDGGRIYRDGGDQLGAALALKWVEAGVGRLTPGGRFLLYTGSAIVAGRDGVREALAALAEARGLSLAYEEIDPDVFGGMLRQDAYRDVERIAAVGAVLTAP